MPITKQFSTQTFRTWHIPSPCHPHYMRTSPPSKIKVIYGPWLKFFDMTRLKFLKLPKTKEFSTQTFRTSMSSPFHTHVCNFQGQDQGNYFYFFCNFAYIPYCNVFKGLCKSYCVGTGGIYVPLTYLVLI
jgi:hypothetical protein